MECVPGDDDRGGVGSAAAGLRDTARERRGEAEERGELSGDVFFNQREGGRDLVHVDLESKLQKEIRPNAQSLQGVRHTFVLSTARISSDTTPTCESSG